MSTNVQMAQERESLETGKRKRPQKKFYRSRAHCNPLCHVYFPIPSCPAVVDWNEHYPLYFPKHQQQQQNHKQYVEIVDIGCGFGGFLIKLATLFPDKLILGMEIRDKVQQFVRERILHLRQEEEGKYNNVSVVRTNSMKFLINYFQKGQLSRMFFLYPDPQFKVANHRRRIINRSLVAEYAYCLREGGLLYTVTDVPTLADWMERTLNEHPLFEKVSQEDLEKDEVVKELPSSSEEGQKVARNQGEVFISVFKRVR
eukprot:TRINITY_DN5742_c0_g1_i1.p1 TRINITY_DN5742_c0_g1~~TRINITY_DN5742_c0_g1_i1.p1  ORF type:complete len:257 (+),score=22.07 TRINITY_DN5742_c0_g1_i1:94-864(+)